jgi:hypothetical protein
MQEEYTMSLMSYEDVLRGAQQLTPEEQLRLIEDLEELADIAAYDAAKAADDDEVIPIEQAIAEYEERQSRRRAAGQS